MIRPIFWVEEETSLEQGAEAVSNKGATVPQCSGTVVAPLEPLRELTNFFSSPRGLMSFIR